MAFGNSLKIKLKNIKKMNNFYAKINLPPKERLLNYDLLLASDQEPKNLFNMHTPEVLTKEANEFFKDNNLTVKFILNFLIPASYPGTESSRVLHTDNRTVDGVRCPIFCGINFELTDPTDITWTWYNTESVPRSYRDHGDSTDFEKEIRMRAEVYNDRGVPEGAVPVERLSYTANDIYLVRTDLPHMITYDCYGKPRSSISIRFEETWNSWEECWEVFKPLMKE